MEALYFPNLSLPASAWVNPSLLFFDRLGVIAPEGANIRIFDNRMNELVEYDLALKVTPRWGDEHEEEEDKFIAYLLGRASVVSSAGDISRVHLGKMMFTPLLARIRELGLLYSAGDWLEGPSWVIAHVMAYLALQTSRQASMPLVSNENSAVRIMAGRDRSSTLVSRRVRAVTRLLPVPPDARPKDIQRFKERHYNELRSFREYITQVSTRFHNDEEGELDFGEELRRVERLRESLSQEMVAFDWRQQGLMLGVSVAGLAAPLIEHSPWSASAGLLSLAYAGSQAIGASRKRKAVAESQLVYAIYAAQRWKPTIEQAFW